MTASNFRQFDYVSHMIEAIELARSYVKDALIYSTQASPTLSARSFVVR